VKVRIKEAFWCEQTQNKGHYQKKFVEFLAIIYAAKKMYVIEAWAE
jgi:hypothetical protein